MSEEAKHELVRRWLHKAQNDLASARKLSAEPDPLLDTAIYHCHQAAEKAVKGFLAYHDHPLQKTHDVRLLVVLAGQYVPGFTAWGEAADLLTPHATAFRYPADSIEPDPEQYQEAEQAADGLLTYVLSLLPDDVHPGKVTSEGG